MEQIYLVMLVALAILASVDLMVGVANDAVNFLNSGIGSKAVSFKTLMVVASIGIALGALFSSGMIGNCPKWNFYSFNVFFQWCNDYFFSSNGHWCVIARYI